MGWIPDDIWYAQKKKGKGKGNNAAFMDGARMVIQTMFGGGGFGGGGRKGKGKGRSGPGGCKDAPEKRMWIGGLPSFEDRDKRVEAEKKLKEVLQQGGECKFAAIMNNGQGVATFPSAEEVAAAIGALQGTKFRGKLLEFDTWEKQEK
mmetsp:Transcript_21422/g.37539  ORF Transcript_21422/g.37539 Transcript_21422/m.37539 type:complete len:148 (+) Transcript_21422:78-521(+)